MTAYAVWTVELLERDGIQDKLLGWLTEAASGEGKVLLLAGEAGIGKTVLLQQFCKIARPKAQVLTGACDPLSTPRPLEPLFDIAMQLGGELERLLEDPDNRNQAFRAFLAALQQASRPSVVVFEDVHWADEATLDLLRFLGRRIGTTRSLLIASYRDDEVGPKHPLQTILGDLATSPSASKLILPPLSAGAVRALSAGTDVDPVQLHSQTNGNPFFVTEVLATGAAGIPSTVRDAVLARAGRLSSRGRAVLEAASVIGSRVEPWLLASVSAAPTEAVEECLDSGILLSHGNLYVFRHELARTALLESILLPRRLELHRTVLEELEGSSLSSQLARLAHHSEEAQDPTAVLRYAPAAARTASSLQAHREAAAQYARALRFAGDLPTSERALLLSSYAQASGFIDQQHQGIPALKEACAIWRSLGESIKEGAALCELAFWSVRAGQNAQAEEACREALRLLQSRPASKELGRAYMTQAYLRMLHRDNEESVEWCRRVLEMPEGLVDTELRIDTYNVMGTAQMMAGEDETGVANLLSAVELAREAGIERLVVLAYSLLGSGSGELHKFERAERYLGRALSVAADHDLDYMRLYSIAWLALTKVYRGRWSEASEAARTVTRRPGAAAVSRIMALIALGRMRTRRGDPESWAALDEALQLATETGTLQRVAPVRSARAEAAWLVGDHARALEETADVFDLARRHRHPWFVGELAYWRWKAGHNEHCPAEAAAPFALQIAGRWREAAAAWRELGCPYEEARALAEGDDVEALRTALQLFEGLGARPAATAAAKRLRELGATGIPRGPRIATRSNPANLTSRELQILRLLDEGLRNREIATLLHLSPKTVGHHVSSILSKLGARNRTEAVREAKALGIVKGSEQAAEVGKGKDKNREPSRQN